MYEQKIYFGAPGTGKSHLIEQELVNVKKEKIFRTVIHPEYSYSDFIGQILPHKDANGVSFDFVPGVLTLSLIEAFADKSENVYLVIEELSRGNVSAIFGDIFQLLDRDSKFESRFPIRNENITSLIPQIVGDQLILPSNLNILCTVNTNDQNVFPMDTAFKRRFDWVYVSTEPANGLNNMRDKNLNNPLIEIHSTKGNFDINWQSFYSVLNDFITDKNGGLGLNEDKQIGQFFIKFKRDDIIATNDSTNPNFAVAKDNVNTILKNKLLLYLWQDIEKVSGFSEVKLFDDSISNFEELYKSFDGAQVFSDEFIEGYLKVNKDKFNYN